MRVVGRYNAQSQPASQIASRSQPRKPASLQLPQTKKATSRSFRKVHNILSQSAFKSLVFVPPFLTQRNSTDSTSTAKHRCTTYLHNARHINAEASKVTHVPHTNEHRNIQVSKHSIFIYAHMHCYLNRYMRAHIHTCIRKTYKKTHPCVNTYLHTSTRTYLPTYQHTYKRHTDIPTYLPTYLHAHMHTQLHTHTYKHACKHACMHAYIQTYICTHTCKYTYCTHAYIQSLTYTGCIDRPEDTHA